MIFYFSGTGNSAWVARRMAVALDERVTDLVAVAANEADFRLAEGEAVGFIFPVHAWGPPQEVLRAVDRMSMMPPDYLFFICTCGDDTGRTAQVFASAVRRKGWSLAAGFSVFMPNTYVSFPGFDVDPPETEERKLREAAARLRLVSQSVCERIRQKRFDCHEGAMPRLKTYVLRPFFHAFLMSPGRFRATKACIGCGRCERVCPLRNVTVGKERHPAWGSHCAHCLACYHACPVGAVHYGRWTHGKGHYRRFI